MSWQHRFFCVALLAAAGCHTTTLPSAPDPVAPLPSATSSSSGCAGEDLLELFGPSVPYFHVRVQKPQVGDRLHHCELSIAYGQLTGWNCQGRSGSVGQRLETNWQEMTALAACVDWRREMVEPGPADAELVYSVELPAQAAVTFRRTPDSESVALRQLRERAFALMQDGLTRIRAAAEPCSNCSAREYCVHHECPSSGELAVCDGPYHECRPRLAAGDACEHNYQCRSHRCAGAAEYYGACQ